MGIGSMWHWLLVLVIILIIFGAGKLPRVMGDFAKGIKAFKAGMKDEEAAESPPQVAPPSQAPANQTAAPTSETRERAS